MDSTKAPEMLGAYVQAEHSKHHRNSESSSWSVPSSVTWNVRALFEFRQHLIDSESSICSWIFLFKNIKLWYLCCVAQLENDFWLWWLNTNNPTEAEGREEWCWDEEEWCWDVDDAWQGKAMGSKRNGKCTRNSKCYKEKDKGSGFQCKASAFHSVNTHFHCVWKLHRFRVKSKEMQC